MNSKYIGYYDFFLGEDDDELENPISGRHPESRWAKLT